jgi:hypothetical protein
MKHSMRNGGTGLVWSVPRPRFDNVLFRKKNGARGTGWAWSIPRPHSGKFFSRGQRGEAVKFAPVTPDIADLQTVTVQQRFGVQGWQTAKSQPYMTIQEPVTPATTYFSPMDESYGSHSPEFGEPAPTSYSGYYVDNTYHADSNYFTYNTYNTR